MKLLALYWGFMVVGFFIAKSMARKGKDIKYVDVIMMYCVYLLCLVMGLRMGVNDQVISNLGVIGLKALLITVICIFASMGAVTLARKLLGMDRKGNVRGKIQEEEHVNSDNQESFDIKGTIIILAIVAIGMIVGALVVARSFADSLDAFDTVTYDSLVVLLCILLFFVGIDLGFSGQLLASLTSVGWKIIVFPFAIMLGTVIAGTATCLIMGFTMRESLAISTGFGWYSYAPVVIANAGQAHIIASAVSFMHNVMRELAGIIFIPLVAKKIGYIESTAVPGIAAMDVCLPIVEKSTRTDTVIYSFATGLIMCFVTSLSVPIAMGV